MDDLINWIEKRMVLVHFGDYIGLRNDLDAAELRELAKEVAKARGIQGVEITREIEIKR